MGSVAPAPAERDVQKSYWLEHSSNPTVEAMMLDSKASEIDQLERPEVRCCCAACARVRLKRDGGRPNDGGCARSRVAHCPMSPQTACISARHQRRAHVEQAAQGRQRDAHAKAHAAVAAAGDRPGKSLAEIHAIQQIASRIAQLDVFPFAR